VLADAWRLGQACIEAFVATPEKLGVKLQGGWGFTNRAGR
jgi:hypothetical protein